MRRNSSNPRKKLGLLPLVAATYFMVSGGPYGIEELVQGSGYKLGLIILFVTPLIWSLPTGLMVGELAAALPADGGFYVWVRRAMGPFWGFQEAWLSLTAGAFDLVAYPVVFVLALQKMWAPANAGHNGVLIAAALIVTCVAWNLFGAGAVGDGSILLGVALLVPFAVLAAVALFHRGSLAAASAASEPPTDWITGLIVAMWNYMGWDNASTVASEVENPQKTYPKVMILALVAILLSYVVPIAVVQRTHVQPAYWSAGSWTKIAALLGGRWLGFAVLIGWMVSTFGIMNSLMMSYSRLPMAMAEDGHLPGIFARRLRNGAPWVSIVLCGATWMTILLAFGINLNRLLLLDILLYGASLVLEFVALVVLRVREPRLERPFMVPGGIPVAILLGIGPLALLMLALAKNYSERLGSISALNLALILMAAGALLYFIAGAPAKSKALAAARS
jgi:amino acid transporter